MRRLLWICLTGCVEDGDRLTEEDLLKDIPDEIKLAGKFLPIAEFFFQLPDGPFLPNGTVVGLKYGESVLDLNITNAHYNVSNDSYWFNVQIRFEESWDEKSLWKYFLENWTAEG